MYLARPALTVAGHATPSAKASARCSTGCQRHCACCASAAACWAHTRRKFYEIAQADGAPIAVEAVRRIAQIYAIEARVRGRGPNERRALRQKEARPLVEALRIWLESQLPKLSARGKLAEAIRYALARWAGLSRFLDDGRIELDTNPVERAIRPVALGRKNHLFAGSDGGGKRWATMASLIETYKLNGVEPHAWLSDVLHRMTQGHPASQLEGLLPWNWKDTREGQQRMTCNRRTLTLNRIRMCQRTGWGRFPNLRKPFWRKSPTCSGSWIPAGGPNWHGGCRFRRDNI